jgi:hypothetical protein
MEMDVEGKEGRDEGRKRRTHFLPNKLKLHLKLLEVATMSKIDTSKHTTLRLGAVKCLEYSKRLTLCIKWLRYFYSEDIAYRTIIII